MEPSQRTTAPARSVQDVVDELEQCMEKTQGMDLSFGRSNETGARFCAKGVLTAVATKARGGQG